MSAKGIQQLLQAEQDAAQMVNDAKQKKVARLRQAKAEALEEIAQYRAKREEQFNTLKQTTMGGSGEHDKKVKMETDEAMKNIQVSMDANKEKIITSLLQSVTTVSI